MRLGDAFAANCIGWQRISAVYQIGYVVDVVPNATAAGTNHFASIRFELFRSGGAYESLRSREETREES